MKRILLMAVAAIITATSVNAQNGYADTKHEVAVSAGVWSNSDVFNAFETIASVLVGVTTDNESFLGPVSVEYFYHLKPMIGLGGIAVYGQMSQDFYMLNKNSGKDGDITNRYVTLMPAVKFDWLRKKHFGMYSKLGLGATLRHETIDYIDASKSDHSSSAVHLNWQVSLLGLETGGSRLRGFMELGMGEQGIGLLGLRYKF
jgi:hypothetical protein